MQQKHNHASNNSVRKRIGLESVHTINSCKNFHCGSHQRSRAICSEGDDIKVKFLDLRVKSNLYRNDITITWLPIYGMFSVFCLTKFRTNCKRTRSLWFRFATKIMFCRNQSSSKSYKGGWWILQIMKCWFF